MMDQRRVRFASLGTLTRADLPLAVEVWLQDAVSAPWATRETMKLAGIFASYILNPNPERLSLGSIEDQHHLQKEPARRALGLMALYGLIDGFSLSADELKAALRLSRMQTLRVLEVRARLSHLERDEVSAAAGAPAVAAKPEEPWLPEDIELPVTAERSAPEPGAEVGKTASLLLRRIAEALAKEATGAEVCPGGAEEVAPKAA